MNIICPFFWCCCCLLFIVINCNSNCRWVISSDICSVAGAFTLSYDAEDYELHPFSTNLRSYWAIKNIYTLLTHRICIFIWNTAGKKSYAHLKCIECVLARRDEWISAWVLEIYYPLLMSGQCVCVCTRTCSALEINDTEKLWGDFNTHAHTLFGTRTTGSMRCWSVT